MFRTSPSSGFGMALGALTVFLCISSAGAVQAGKELQIRAAFLLNFVRFTEWPEEALPENDGEFVVAVLGTDPFGDVLDQTFSQQKVQNRGIQVKRFRMPNRRDYDKIAQYEKALIETLEEVAASQVIYMNLPNPDEATFMLERLDEPHTLIIGHSKGYAEQGAHLALDRADENIVFYANVDAIKESELDVSSKLLKLARVVKTVDGGDRR
jgi:hypothetical protein